MTLVSVQLPEALQTLVDSRLDTIERMLMGRVPRQDRLGIVRDVETQIHELLQETPDDRLDREAVLAALARLDPPEAYLPEVPAEALEGGEARPMLAPRPAPARRPGRADRLSRVSGILGICGLVALGLFPLSYLSMFVLGEFGLLIGWIGGVFLTLVLGTLAVVFGACARLGNTWAVAGFVAGILAVMGSLLGCLAAVYALIAGI